MGIRSPLSVPSARRNLAHRSSCLQREQQLKLLREFPYRPQPHMRGDLSADMKQRVKFDKVSMVHQQAKMVPESAALRREAL